MYTGENLRLISTDRKQKQIKKSYTTWLPGSNLNYLLAMLIRLRTINHNTFTEKLIYISTRMTKNRAPLLKFLQWQPPSLIITPEQLPRREAVTRELLGWWGRSFGEKWRKTSSGFKSWGWKDIVFNLQKRGRRQHLWERPQVNTHLSFLSYIAKLPLVDIHWQLNSRMVKLKEIRRSSTT